jgi:thioredoxin reductase
MIVGAGPTGLTAALELTRLKIPVRGGGMTSSVVWLATALTPEFGQSPGVEVFETLQKLRLA